MLLKFTTPLLSPALVFLDDHGYSGMRNTPSLSAELASEGMAGARGGAVALFGIFWLLGPGPLRSDIFFCQPPTGGG